MVDLRDDYNQRTVQNGSLNYPNDQIKNVPYSVMDRLGTEAANWAMFEDILDDYIGIYFTRAEFDNYCEFWRTGLYNN